MPIIKLRDIGSKGVIKDLVPHEVPEGFLTEAFNVRFSARGILRWPNSAPVYENLAGPAVWMDSCYRGDGAAVFYASTTRLYISDFSGGMADVSYNGQPYAASNEWHSEPYGRTMIFNSPVNLPQVMEEADLAFKPLPNWPTDSYAKVMRVYKNFFIAMGIQEITDEKQNVVWWSDAAYNNGVPPNWDYNDPASLSGQNTLGPGDGRIVDGAPMGDQFIIYTENSAHSMQFVGGPFTMQFRELFKFGALNRDCIGVFERKHFVVGPVNIYVHDGVNVTRIAEGKVERTIYSTMLDRSKVRVEVNQANYEVMIYYRSNLEGQPYIAWIWNYHYNTWTRVQLPKVVCVHYGPRESDFTQWSDLQTNGILWSNLKKKWSELSGGPQQFNLFQLSNDNVISQLFYDYSSDEVRPYKRSFIQRLGIDLDQLEGMDSSKQKYIRRVYPIVTGDNGAVLRFRFGWSKTPDQAPAWKAWQTYTVGSSYKVDTRVNGRYLAWEMECLATDDGGWALTGLDIEVDLAGGR